MARFLHIQCKLRQLRYPIWGKKWINIRKTFSNFYDVHQTKLYNMLDLLGMEFEGQLHSGIDDSRNIARIAIQLVCDGCDIQINEQIFTPRVAPPIKCYETTEQDALVQCVANGGSYRQQSSRQNRQQQLRHHQSQRQQTPRQQGRNRYIRTRRQKKPEDDKDAEEIEELLRFINNTHISA